MRKLHSIFVAILAVMLTVQPAFAWSEGGHNIIAMLAFDLMKPAKQKRVIELLEKHPRFAEDFKPGPKIADLNHWIIGRAGYWPDVARDQPAFNRPNWHYQLGATLTIGSTVKVHPTPGPLPTGATLETKDLHIAQAIELCRQPLYLKVLFEEARQWSSWHQPPVPAQTVGELLIQVLERLSLPERHGPLVAPALSCLVAAKYGLTENELLEILFRDQEYKADFTKSTYHRLPEAADRIPIAIWSGLRHDLAPYLTERGAPGGVVLQFFHRQVANAIRGLFAHVPEQKARRHRQLILYFARQHWWLEPRSEQRKRMSPPYSARPVNVRKVTELPEQLIQFVRSAQLGNSEFDTACRWLEKTFQNIEFLEAKNEAGRVFELAEDFTRAVPAIPDSRPEHQVLRLLEEALRRDIHFIDRHSSDYPQGLFQCLWNSCWWYDCPQLIDGYLAEGQDPEADPDDVNYETMCVSRVLERWRQTRTRQFPGYAWARALRPPILPIGSAQIVPLPENVWGVDQVCLLGDGTRLAAQCEWGVAIWNLIAARLEHPHHCSEFSNVTCMSGSSNGSLIAVGFQSAEGHEVAIWDVESGETKAARSGLHAAVNTLAFSLDDEAIISGFQDGTVVCWNWSRNTLSPVQKVHDGPVWDLAVCRHPYSVVTASKDSTVRVSFLHSPETQVVFRKHRTPVRRVALSPDHTRIASCGDEGTIQIWSLTNPEAPIAIEQHNGALRSIAFSPCGTMVAAGTRTGAICICDSASGLLLNTLEGHEAPVMGLAFSTNGSYLVSGARDHTVRLWNYRRKSLRKKWKWDNEAFLPSRTAWCFSSDGRKLATLSRDEIVIWETANQNVSTKLRATAACSTISLSADGRFLACGDRNGQVTVRDLNLDQLICRFEAHAGCVSSVAVSVDGSYAASSGEDGTIVAVRVLDNRSTQVLPVQEGRATALSFSGDNKRLAGWCSASKVLRIWDLSGGELRQRRQMDDCMSGIQFSGDSNWIDVQLAHGAATRLRVADLEPVGKTTFDAFEMYGIRIPDMGQHLMHPNGWLLATIGEFNNTLTYFRLEGRAL